VPSSAHGAVREFVGPRHRLRQELLLRRFLAAGPGPRVLDAGAGHGSMTRLLAAHGFEVTSVDVSEAAVETLREAGAGEVRQADLTVLPFAEGSFDAVVLSEVLEHLDDDVAGLREAARVTRPGGVLAVSVPAGRWGPSDDWAGHRRRYDRTSLERLFAAAGVRLERCDAWGFPFSALYHRHLYERRLERRGSGAATPGERRLLRLLGLVLQADQLFVGVERGALGFLAIGRTPAATIGP
jgi:SAM-dependent methyltransferase